MSNPSGNGGADFNQFKYSVPTGTLIKLEFIASLNKNFKKPGVAFLKYLYVVGTVTWHYINTHAIHKKSSDYKGCTLNITRLTNILGTKNGETCNIIDDLIQYEILQRVGGYIKNCKSFDYKLKDTTKDFESINLFPEFERISKKLIIKHNEFYRAVSEDLILYKSFLDKIKVYELDIYLDKHKEIESELYLMMGEFENSNELQFGTINHKINLVLKSLIDIQRGDSYIHRKNPKSRVHTPLTVLKREAKAVLRFEGKGFIELDIRNSQPLIASILIKNYWVQKNMDIPQDVKQYIKDCENGSFYDYFMALNNVSSDERTDFKKRFFAEVFFSKVTKRQTVLKKQFKNKYPNCDKAICDLKGGTGSERYNEFSILLQTKEAQIIFDNVNMGLIRQNIPAFNIFDSILCLAEDENRVRERLLDAFRSHNLCPTINTNDYTANMPIEAVMALIEDNKATMRKNCKVEVSQTK
ncbi:hypothetical protein [Mucilaginibacter phyllosphaerae]|uniref:Uncharacterized protein n=1 Tax=Mucilaginibacter phyllosphaerae TaxID=1812349 RepID=A0A4Y8A9Z3_9SPHI|nr:hypothetical protein [Mucilaginibacter phyllosphaerae]MBB3969903.1 hypothetical protein [Mucilaginibacter phyllosphaerae]TEW65277.1 hypothetical protein E2R65_15305 [Mucilaginibacter phyllosphaerae]GGH16889.1 hypothetical protein GCM10007352_26600 [Mucilaginibacter phyllosphaerae]